MPPRPIVIVHGYSDRGATAGAWVHRLTAAGHRATDLHVMEYVSLSNEVTIKDIAEGFDRALGIRARLDADEEFDAIVHSTGMLVVRAWLTSSPSRARRLKHLVGLAPATFGSPMAHKGRSFLGAIFKGNRRFGPDFMEAGDRVLAGLELGSAFTWWLAHQDLLAARPVYGPDAATPYPFVFIGLRDYGLLKRIATEPGTDGTVRWAAAGFNCRKITMDLTREPGGPDDPHARVSFGGWSNEHVPLVLLDDHNHGTIFGEPTPALVEAVIDALEVSDAEAYAGFRATYEERNERARVARGAHRWQQFVTRVTDERGDPIPDYYVELYSRQADGALAEIEPFSLDVHAYRDDTSFRCFHVDLDATGVERLPGLWLRLIASSGSKLVGYHGFGSERMTPRGRPAPGDGKWDAAIDLSEHLAGASPAPEGGDLRFFMPFTTTLVEIRMNREPMPLDVREPNRVAWFLDDLPGV